MSMYSKNHYSIVISLQLINEKKSCLLGFSIIRSKNFLDVQVGFRNGRETKDQIVNICWIAEKAREFQENIYLCFINYAKVFVWIMTNCGKLLKRWEYQTILPVIIRDVEHDSAVCCHHVCLTYSEHIMRKAGLNELQAGIEIGGRSINNHRYVDDTTLMTEREEDLEFLDQSEGGE